MVTMMPHLGRDEEALNNWPWRAILSGFFWCKRLICFPLRPRSPPSRRFYGTIAQRIVSACPAVTINLQG
ncbi:MAG: hypothetical protein QM756_16510 [Polyangiaceae bacterium]